LRRVCITRHLDVDEVLARQRERHVREIAQHNAEVLGDIGVRVPPRRDQVLDEFDPGTRRLAR
jgi:hypothetical protein